MMSFAAFIMTYDRPVIIIDTINKLFSQTFPPEKILIVDNSDSFLTRDSIFRLSNAKVEYYKVGYNAGPAGAAKIGLQILAQQGFEWIYWGDDNDPPPFPDTFNSLFKILDIHSRPYKIGQLGMVGHHFDFKKGVIIRVTDDELLNSSFLPVDMIAGGQVKIVNKAVIQAGVLPNSELFFGFEELDFDIKTKKAGFQMIVSSTDFLRVRAKYNHLSYKEPYYTIKTKRGLIREYYSIRNLIRILKSNHLYTAFIYQIMKALIKSVYGFRFGFGYGKINFSMVLLGLGDGLINRSGKRF